MGYRTPNIDRIASELEDRVAEQRCQGTLRIWAEPFTPLRVPKLFNLRTDPYEYADITSNTYYEWFLRRDFRLVRDGDGVGVPGHIQGVPASAPTSQLQHRSDRQETRRVSRSD